MSLRQRRRRTADGGTTHDLASLPPTWLASCTIQAAVAVFPCMLLDGPWSYYHRTPFCMRLDAPGAEGVQRCVIALYERTQ